MFDRHDVEDIILCMADIVRENRNLRYEVARLEKIVEQYDKELRSRVNESDRANKELLKMLMENALMGGNVND